MSFSKSVLSPEPQFPWVPTMYQFCSSPPQSSGQQGASAGSDMTYKTRHIRTARVISSLQDTGCVNLPGILHIFDSMKWIRKKWLVGNQTKVLWLKLYFWALTAHTRGVGLIPSDCQFWNHFPFIFTPSNVNWVWSLPQDHLYLPSSGGWWRGTGRVRCRRWTSTPLPHLRGCQCEDNHVMMHGKKDWSLSCLWLDQHKTSPVDLGLQISIFLHVAHWGWNHSCGHC